MNKYENAAKLLDDFYYAKKSDVENRKRFSNEQTEKIFASFQNKYSARWLGRVKKEEVLERIFRNTVDDYTNYESMVFKLLNENSDNPLAYFGHISQQYTNLLPFYIHGGLWAYGRGMPDFGKTVYESTAKETAFIFKNKLAEILQVTEEADFKCIDDYIEFSNHLKTSLQYSPQAWLHKYLHMLYPNAFSDFNTKSYKKTVLKIFGIPIVEDDQIVLAGQIAEIFRNMTVPGFYTKACVLYTVSGFLNLAKKEKPSEEEFEKVYQNIVNKMVDKSAKNAVSKNPIEIIEESVDSLEITRIKEDEEEDLVYNLSILTTELSEIDISKCVIQPKDAPKPIEVNNVKKYPRNPKTAAISLKRANYKCEYDSAHQTFPKASDGLPYTEAHHLIPMSQQGNFKNSLDCPANIISLCCTCHRCIHFGNDQSKRIMLYDIYRERVEELKSAGIYISFETLVKMYI